MTFSCDWGIFPIVITIFVIILILCFYGKLFPPLLKRFFYKGKDHFFVCFYLVISVISIFPLIFCLFYMPLNISITEKTISIKQINGNISILLSDVISVERFYQKKGNNFDRILGSGGFLGFLGKFENSEIGEIQMFVTNPEKMILIKTSQKKFLVSCDDPDSFVKVFN